MSRAKQLFKLFGSGLTLATHTALFIIFLRAYRHPTQSTLVHVNLYDEADIELIGMIIITIISIVGFYYVYKELCND